jgi:hypothetical protein
MNITYIIGNGFDLNLGLKTSYKDFYEYYERTNSPNDDVQSLKNEIKKDENKLWSDLEFALGQYTKKVSDPKTMIYIFEDLENNLNNYLLGVDKLIPLTNEKIKSFFLQDIAKPESYLERTDREKMQNFYNFYTAQLDAGINIITLNYTSSIEKLLDYQNDQPIKIPFTCFNRRQTNLKNIYHLHHALDNTILVGVNDETQIANENFRKNLDLREILIKPEANKMRKNGVDNDCKYIIKNTNLFVLFGVSIGATDKMWWQMITEQLKGNVRMILFNHDENFKKDIELGMKERGVKSRFLSYSDLSDDLKQTISDHIFVPVNKGIFSNIKSLVLKSFRSDK